MRRRKYVRKCVSKIAVAFAGAALLAGCGSSSSSSSSGPPVSGLKKRVLLTNSVVNPSVLEVTPTSAGLTIVDAQKDTLAKALSSSPFSKILTASGQSVLLNVGARQITFVDNTKEQVTFSPVLVGQPFDIAMSSDGKTVYAAVRDNGLVEAVATSNGNIAAAVPIPSVTRLVEGPMEQRLLAFSDDPQNLVGSTNGVPNANSFFVVNTNGNAVAAITLPAGSQPYTAVFDPTDTNDTTAFILNCGSECGGSVPPGGPVPPNVVKVNFSNPAAPVFTPSVAGIPVSGATVGLLSGSSLFVAGTPTGSATGTLQVIDTGALTASAPFTITNGLHTQMALTSNNRLYVGASNCTIDAPDSQNQVAGCLSIFDTSSQTVKPRPRQSAFRQNFNVTGLQQISARNIMYVCQGGELDIFDITLDAVSPSITQIDVIGNAFGVVQIDP
jgi:uncharacterized lipoprotein YajG